jgi:hypothetical protein
MRQLVDLDLAPVQFPIIAGNDLGLLTNIINMAASDGSGPNPAK